MTALRFPSPHALPAPTLPLSPYPALAVILTVGAFVFGLTGAFWAGRQVERGSQFGQVLALGQEQAHLAATVALQDSTLRRLGAFLGHPRPPGAGRRIRRVQAPPTALAKEPPTRQTYPVP